MNLGKAREYFSDYLEGTLDKGLAVGLEKAMREDREIKREYDEFVAVIHSLESMRENEVEIPYDLHEKISARLDLSVWETKQSVKPSWFSGWWRSLAVGGAAACAIVATLASLNSGGQGYSAGVVSGSSEPLSVALKNGQMEVTAISNGAQQLIIRDVLLGKDLKRVSLKDQRMISMLQNNDFSGRLISIELGSSKLMVALPKTGGELNSQGNVSDLCVTLAGKLNMPIIVGSELELGREINWDIRGEQVQTQPDLNLQVEKRGGLNYLKNPESSR
jgi:hypothetical protein